MGIRVTRCIPGYIETPMVSNTLHNIENGNDLRDVLITRHALGRFRRAEGDSERDRVPRLGRIELHAGLGAGDRRRLKAA